jgi:hypothetical protein
MLYTREQDNLARQKREVGEKEMISQKNFCDCENLG